MVSSTSDDTSRPTATAIFVGNGTPISLDFTSSIVKHEEEDEEVDDERSIKLEPPDDNNYEEEFDVADEQFIQDDEDERRQRFDIVKCETDDNHVNGIFIKEEEEEFVDDEPLQNVEYLEEPEAPPVTTTRRRTLADIVGLLQQQNTIVEPKLEMDEPIVDRNMPELMEEMLPTPASSSSFIDDETDDPEYNPTISGSTGDERYFLKKKANQLKMLSRQMEAAQNRRRFFGSNNDDDFSRQQSHSTTTHSSIGRLKELRGERLKKSRKTLSSRFVVKHAEDDGGDRCQLCGIRFYSNVGLQKHYVSVHRRTNMTEEEAISNDE